MSSSVEISHPSSDLKKLNGLGRRYTAAIVVALLVAHALLADTSIEHKGLTYDESGHLMRGLSFWRHPDNRLILHQPALAPAWAVLPLLDDDLTYPTLEQDSWYRCNVYQMADQFLFGLGNDREAILRKARRMTILISLAMGMVVFLWSRVLFGTAGGIISLALYVLSPTVLAHARLVTTDTMTSLFFVLSVAAIWRVLHHFGVWSVASTCVALSGLFLSKLSALIIVPVGLLLLAIRIAIGRPLLVQFGWSRTIRRRWIMVPVFGALLVFVVFAVGLSVWVAYDFEYDAISNARPGIDALPLLRSARGADTMVSLFAWLREHKVLPEAYLYKVFYVMQGIQENDAFLDGARSTTGWWYFFPACFAYKVPLPITCIILLSIFAAVTASMNRTDRTPRPIEPSHREWRTGLYGTAPLWALIVVCWAVVMKSHLNIGHRHVLPTFAPMFILCGASSLWLRSPSRWARFLPLVCLACLVAVTLRAWPHYLAYFNGIAGGSRSGYRHLVDSSLDWGQDLPGLKRWLETERTKDEDRSGSATPERVYLSYMGTDNPNYYGIRAQMLPSCVEESWQPERKYKFAGGIYCISATTLQQVYMLPDTQWTPALEASYQSALRGLMHFRRFSSPHDENDGPGGTTPNSGIRGSGLGRERAWKEYERLAFGRLCAVLRLRKPDAQIGYSINIYRLSDDDVADALEGPAKELFMNWPMIDSPR
jgi:hypothetical protein